MGAEEQKSQSGQDAIDTASLRAGVAAARVCSVCPCAWGRPAVGQDLEAVAVPTEGPQAG